MPADRRHYVPNVVDTTPLPAEPRARQGTRLRTRRWSWALAGYIRNKEGFNVPDPGGGAGAARPSLERGCGIAGRRSARAGTVGITDRVSFLGWLADVAALYAAANVFICASRHEPLGNIVLEAWAHRVPVVAAASQGPSELITYGVNGLLVPVDSDAAMTASIETVLRETMVAGGRAT